MNDQPQTESSGLSTPELMKKEREKTATIACDACRSRKQKCDERKPACGYCRRTGITCEYRAPKPTKRDKSLQEILEILGRIEPDIHETRERSADIATIYLMLESLKLQSQTTAKTFVDNSGDGIPTTSTFQTSGLASLRPHQGGQYQYVSATHQMMRWDAVRQVLEAAEPKIDGLEAVFQNPNFAAVMLEHQGRAKGLPCDRILQGEFDWGSVPGRSTLYFDTFNLIHPVLDQETFMNHTIQSAAEDNLGTSADSTLMYLVLALAEIAAATLYPEPIYADPGSHEEELQKRPPGLRFFNEARQRMGFLMAGCTLENIQIYILAGLYYECCSRHMEFCRMTISASLACHRLITSDPGQLRSGRRGNLIRRMFWYCSMMESKLNLELEIPLTSLVMSEGEMSTRDVFSGSFGHGDTEFYEEHFRQQVRLKSFADDIHRTMTAITIRPTSVSGPYTTAEQDFTSLRLFDAVGSIARVLSSWREELVGAMRWFDSNAAIVPSQSTKQDYDHFLQEYQTPVQDLQQSGFVFSIDPRDVARNPFQPSFSGEGLNPIHDVLDALLRSRYYYLRCLLYGPFIFKVLHNGRFGPRDRIGAAEYLRACLMWPILKPPVCFRKSLISCLIFWSHKILGILIILHLSTKHEGLRQVREGLGPSFESEAEATVILCIDWIKSLKDIDGSARWCWTIVKRLYQQEDDETSAQFLTGF